MRLLLDKNLSYRLCAMLEGHGLDARHVDDLELGEAADDVILAAAREDDRIVVSSDTHFGGLLAAARAARPSVILARAVADLRATALAELLVAAIDGRRRHSTLARSSRSAVPTCESDACRCDEPRGTAGGQRHGTPRDGAGHGRQAEA